MSGLRPPADGSRDLGPRSGAERDRPSARAFVRDARTVSFRRSSGNGKAVHANALWPGSGPRAVLSAVTATCEYVNSATPLYFASCRGDVLRVKRPDCRVVPRAGYRSSDLVRDRGGVLIVSSAAANPRTTWPLRAPRPAFLCTGGGATVGAVYLMPGDEIAGAALPIFASEVAGGDLTPISRPVSETYNPRRLSRPIRPDRPDGGVARGKLSKRRLPGVWIAIRARVRIRHSIHGRGTPRVSLGSSEYRGRAGAVPSATGSANSGRVRRLKAGRSHSRFARELGLDRPSYDAGTPARRRVALSGFARVPYLAAP